MKMYQWVLIVAILVFLLSILIAGPTIDIHMYDTYWVVSTSQLIRIILVPLLILTSGIIWWRSRRGA